MLAAINSVTSAAGASLESAASPVASFAPPSGAAPFADLFTGAVGQVDGLEAHAQAAVAGLIAGTGVDVHQAIIATQKASMAFELALSVRNKAVQAYQSVLGMQF